MQTRPQTSHQAFELRDPLECAEGVLRVGVVDVAAVGQNDQFLGRNLAPANSIGKRGDGRDRVRDRRQRRDELLLSHLHPPSDLPFLGASQQAMTADLAEIRADRIELRARGGARKLGRLFFRLVGHRPLGPFAPLGLVG